MTYLVMETCKACKYTDCVEHCPVDAFHEGPEMLYINPEVCIDCNACVADCPIGAILEDTDLREDQYYLFDINEEGSRMYPVITEVQRSRSVAQG